MRLPTLLESTRLHIRPHRLDDFDGFFAFLSNPEATRYITFSSEERTREGSKAFFEEIIATYDTERPVFGLAIEERETQTYAGFCGLVNMSEEQGAEVYYVLLPEFRRKGYAKELAEVLFDYAFETLQISRLTCFFPTENAAAQRTVEQLGMVDNGMTEHDAYPEPVHRYTLWRKNWRQS
ncbi:MAG: GNAT family N-acetyltransferase [Bacteroidota bacterium]